MPVVARWLWQEWGRSNGQSLADESAKVAARISASGPEQSLVLLVEGEPAATASLLHHDLPTRRDLTPWLGGVFTEPRFRGRGFATQVVKAVEAACWSAGIPKIWLFTNSAIGLYAGLGWREAGIEPLRDTEVTLMCRVLPDGSS